MKLVRSPSVTPVHWSPRGGGPDRFMARVPVSTIHGRTVNEPVITGLDRPSGYPMSHDADIHMECGHYTPLEDDIKMSRFRPKGRGMSRKHWCESCQKWKQQYRQTFPTNTPDEPMF